MKADFWKVPVALLAIVTSIIAAGVISKSLRAAFAMLGIWVVYFAGLNIQDKIIERRKKK